MKKLISFFLTAAMIFSMLPVIVLAATPGLGNFKKENTYFPGQFTDVSSSDWFADEVSAAYELGLVKGTSATTFSPTGKIKISEVITLASRLHSIYYDNGTEFVQGSPWYQVYVNYAIDNGIISMSQFSNYNANATRAEFATVLASALPNEAFKAINDIKSIPDVSDYASYRNAVYKLYNAGILTGNDSYGTFTPNNDIKRSEVSAIISRIAIPTARKEFSLATLNKAGNLSADVSSISLKAGESTTFMVTMTKPDATVTVNYNPNMVRTTWGEWDGYDIPLTIKALQDGYSELEIFIEEEPSSIIYIDVNLGENGNQNSGTTSLKIDGVGKTFRTYYPYILESNVSRIDSAEYKITTYEYVNDVSIEVDVIATMIEHNCIQFNDIVIHYELCNDNGICVATGEVWIDARFLHQKYSQTIYFNVDPGHYTLTFRDMYF